MKESQNSVEQDIAKILFGSEGMDTDYAVRDNLPSVYKDLQNYLGADEERVLRAFVYINELQAYTTFLKDNLKEISLEVLDIEALKEFGYRKNNRTISVQSRTIYDYNASSRHRALKKDIKNLEDKMKEAAKNEEETVFDDVAGEYIPCAKIKSTSTTLVVKQVRNESEDV